MAEVKMEESGVSKNGEAIYIASSVLRLDLDYVNKRVPSKQWRHPFCFYDVNRVALSEEAVCHLRNERYDLASAVGVFRY